MDARSAPPIRALVVPVTPLRQNGTIVWCEHTRKAAVIDPGGEAPRLLKVLTEQNLELKKIWITHSHLDHAGGAGSLLQALPAARVVAHPRSAPHLIDPVKLITASKAVYGEERYRELYGELKPIDANRILITEDEQRMELRGR